MFWLQWSIQELTMHHTRILTTMWIWSMQEHSGWSFNTKSSSKWKPFSDPESPAIPLMSVFDALESCGAQQELLPKSSLGCFCTFMTFKTLVTISVNSRSVPSFRASGMMWLTYGTVRGSRNRGLKGFGSSASTNRDLIWPFIRSMQIFPFALKSINSFFVPSFFLVCSKSSKVVPWSWRLSGRRWKLCLCKTPIETFR